jgi:hypothetical protein
VPSGFSPKLRWRAKRIWRSRLLLVANSSMVWRPIRGLPHPTRHSLERRLITDKPGFFHHLSANDIGIKSASHPYFALLTLRLAYVGFFSDEPILDIGRSRRSTLPWAADSTQCSVTPKVSARSLQNKIHLDTTIGRFRSLVYGTGCGRHRKAVCREPSSDTSWSCSA